ncbi:MAG: FMN-binding protein [Micrococcales bacterium]
MSRNVRVKVANTFIAASAIAGGLVLTNHFHPFTAASASTPTPTPSGSSSAPAGSGGSGGKSGTKTSDAIPYQFGQVQLTVTEANGKITAIDYSNSSASNGREQAYPYLVQYAIKANGSNFGNLSGATYTTQAFQQALDNALAKF